MRRQIESLVNREHDLVVVGGGIFGICTAWDAALRGLRVALIERGDFCEATSANCFKIVHGGIRYLQHGDVYRIRESSHERRALLRIAPHLVHPLPTVVPTYGRGLKGKEFLTAGMGLYDVLTWDRNRGVPDPHQHIPPARSLSHQECLDLFSGLDHNNLTGGMLFHDGQMYNPPRLALSFLKSAANSGAAVANYVEATSFVKDGNRVLGVEAQDLLTGERLTIRGKVVVNAAGPWAERLLGQHHDLELRPRLTYSRDAALVVRRQLTGKYALAVQGGTRDPGAILNRGNRHLFMVPWRDYTLIGVWHMVYQGHPDQFTLTEEEIQGFLNELNASYSLQQPLTISDVSMWNAGLVLFGENDPNAVNLRYGKRSLIVDHENRHGVPGLVTVVGVRYTTARGVAEKAVNLVFQKLGKAAPRCLTATTPIHGGDIENFSEFARNAKVHCQHNLDSDVLHSLIRNHGSAWKDVLQYADSDPYWSETIGPSRVVKAEVVHAVREEMAQKLKDVVFRRTDLGTGEHPGDAALRTTAALMADELGWSQYRVQQEMDEVQASFPTFNKVPA